MAIFCIEGGGKVVSFAVPKNSSRKGIKLTFTKEIFDMLGGNRGEETMRNHFLTVVSRAAGVCLLSLIFCASALGQNNWINPAGGNYGVGANWSGGAVPLTP